MRRVRRPKQGPPPAILDTLDEAVLLLQAAIETANVERWALEHGEQAPPSGLKGLLRKNAYEVSVVDAFHRLARRHFERHGYVGVWERPLTTGKVGRPKTIDVSLFDTTNQQEGRIELGGYTKTKVKSDSKKLYGEAQNPGLPNYTVAFNVLALWQVRESKTTDALMDGWVTTFKADAAAASTGQYSVELLRASVMDIFVADASGHRYAVVGLSWSNS